MSRLSFLLAGLWLGLSIAPSVSAADNGGGGSGGWFCRLMCHVTHGSCTIPSGDPDIPPLKDPFCEQRRNACLARCSGGGAGGGGFFIGFEAQTGQCPAPSASISCDAPVDG